SFCDEEIDILEDYGGDFTADSKIPCFYFIKQALPPRGAGDDRAGGGGTTCIGGDDSLDRAGVSYIRGGGGGCSEGTTSCKGGGDTTPCNVGRGGVGVVGIGETTKPSCIHSLSCTADKGFELEVEISYECANDVTYRASKGLNIVDESPILGYLSHKNLGPQLLQG
nr:importin subunit beta-1 [Tanacetum cinerariifolium]